MALKATIHKAHVQIADMDRGIYAAHALTLARHPSETDERMLLRVLAFALHVPADDHHGTLDFGVGLSDPDAPDVFQRDLTGDILHWIELGQPDERRLQKASSRSEQVSVYSYAASTPIWWAGIVNKLDRMDKVAVWQIPAESSAELAKLVERSMQWQVTIQDGTVWITDGPRTVEITPILLKDRRTKYA
ncbi:YaeQ family protein [Leptothrix ochracea]|uniref:YaeQ family protein n=1 Tax=Leptothrix ochracea TaxID=735331 RepID=UPI0034E2BA2B